MDASQQLQPGMHEQLTSLAKIAKLSRRAELLHAGDITSSENAMRAAAELKTFVTVEYIAHGEHDRDELNDRRLADNLHQYCIDINGALTKGLGSDRDKRRKLLDTANVDAMQTDSSDHACEEIARLMNSSRPRRLSDHTEGREAFTKDDARRFVALVRMFHDALEERVEGLSTFFADERADNVASFYSQPGIDEEIERLTAIARDKPYLRMANPDAAELSFEAGFLREHRAIENQPGTPISHQLHRDDYKHRHRDERVSPLSQFPEGSDATARDDIDAHVDRYGGEGQGAVVEQFHALHARRQRDVQPLIEDIPSPPGGESSLSAQHTEAPDSRKRKHSADHGVPDEQLSRKFRRDSRSSDRDIS